MAAIDARRFWWAVVEADEVDIFEATVIWLAFLAQPVKVKSACLKFCTKSWSAFVPVSATVSCIR
jgi:hypothetical protein